MTIIKIPAVFSRFLSENIYYDQESRICEIILWHLHFYWFDSWLVSIWNFQKFWPTLSWEILLKLIWNPKVTFYAVYHRIRIKSWERHFKTASDHEDQYYDDASIVSIVDTVHRPGFDDGSSELWVVLPVETIF